MAALQNKAIHLGKLKEATSIPDDRFHKTVRARVEDYLAKRHWSRHFYEWITLGETGITFLLYCIAYYYLLRYNSYPAASLLGILTARFGFLMHMGNHAATSKSSKINERYGLLMDFIGSNHFIWSFEHQVAHHLDPNEVGKDNDCSIGDPYLRFNTHIERKWWHKYNHFLTLFAMMFGTFRWYVGDFMCFRAGEVGSIRFYPNAKDWAGLIFWKIIWFVRIVALPYYFQGWSFVGPWVLHMMITGYYLENIFIVNHIQGDLLPPKEKHWAVKNCFATANWGTGSHFWNFVSSGLNHQVEHHLFPSVSHYLYPCISQVVIDTCREFNIPFYNYPSYAHAWYSMFKHLEALGNEGELNSGYGKVNLADTQHSKLHGS